MNKGFDIPHNKHLGNTHYYWYSKKTNKGKLLTEKKKCWKQ